MYSLFTLSINSSSCDHRRQLALVVKKKSTKSDTQKVFVQEKRNVLMRQIRRWQQVQLIYMPGAVVPSFSTNDRDADENDTGETPENIPLVLPSEVESTRRRAVCLHQVAEYK